MLNTFKNYSEFKKKEKISSTKFSFTFILSKKEQEFLQDMTNLDWAFQFQCCRFAGIYNSF